MGQLEFLPGVDRSSHNSVFGSTVIGYTVVVSLPKYLVLFILYVSLLSILDEVK